MPKPVKATSKKPVPKPVKATSKKPVPKPVKATSKKLVKKIADEEEISFSSLDHVLTPLHEKLSEDEIDHILKTYNLTKAQLPAISLSDPAVKHVDVQSGDVVKITRDSPTSGVTYFYRMVINIGK